VWLAAVCLAVLAAACGFWWGKSQPTSSATPEVMHGRVGLVGAGGDEFYYTPDGSAATISYGMSTTVPWLDADGGWHQGSAPACMAPLSKGQHISFGVVHVNGNLGQDVVVWIDCG
jgi:hypothetical protein